MFSTLLSPFRNEDGRMAPLSPRLKWRILGVFSNSSIVISVYSSWEVGKLQCFSWIKERFSGPNVQFCVIGDGWEECEAAESMRWPFVKIDPRPSSFHRFPGLTPKDLGHYFSVVYGDSDEKIMVTSSFWQLIMYICSLLKNFTSNEATMKYLLMVGQALLFCGSRFSWLWFINSFFINKIVWHKKVKVSYKVLTLHERLVCTVNFSMTLCLDLICFHPD
ncbi:hypothetical protein HAX54_038695 [Datura stramonium]|uniref:protein-tyrosine-phosphatase n=1 Tax=Datura stramonium TaxID=4076 RepID=A0ABS8RNE2_DATST|nr:hypothetical protein [Datura stramonium]